MFEDLYRKSDGDEKQGPVEAEKDEWDTELVSKKDDTWSTGQVKDDVWSVG